MYHLKFLLAKLDMIVCNKFKNSTDGERADYFLNKLSRI